MIRKILSLVFAIAVATPFFGLSVSEEEVGIAPAEADAVCGPSGYSCGTSASNAICCNNSSSCCTSSTGMIYCGNPGCNK
jgi:predicted S18 family serine protease